MYRCGRSENDGPFVKWKTMSKFKAWLRKRLNSGDCMPRCVRMLVRVAPAGYRCGQSGQEGKSQRKALISLDVFWARHVHTVGEQRCVQHKKKRRIKIDHGHRRAHESAGFWALSLVSTRRLWDVAVLRLAWLGRKVSNLASRNLRLNSNLRLIVSLVWCIHSSVCPSIRSIHPVHRSESLVLCVCGF